MLVFKLDKLNPIQCHTAQSARQGWAFAGKWKGSDTALMYEMKEMVAGQQSHCREDESSRKYRDP
jgi:hypothetical protein